MYMKHNCVLCGSLTDKRRKRCGSCNTKIRRYRTKLRAIIYLGGQCKQCGNDKLPHYCYDIHHRNDKEFSLSNVANKSWEVIRKELDKCELLCVLCHRGHHHEQESLAFWDAIFNYQGKDGEWLTPKVLTQAKDFGFG